MRATRIFLVGVTMAALVGWFGPAPASAAATTITGTVVDNGAVPIGDVAVEVLPAGGSAVVTSTTTDSNGQFTVSVAAGSYDLRFTPPADSGLHAFLATGVDSTNPTPLTVVLKPIATVHLTGHLTDAAGGAYPFIGVSFRPLSGAPSTVQTNANGDYSLDLLAGQYKVGVSTFVPSGGPLQVNFLTPVDFESNQTYNITLPTKTLSVSVRDTTGQPVTGGRLMFDFSSVSNPPLFDGSMTETSTTVPIDSNGNLSIALLLGLVPTNPRIVLNSSGLSVPFSVPAMDTDRSIAVTVPPSVHLTGHLTDAAGGAYPFIGVSFRPLSGAAASTVQTNASGNYSVDLLAGQYKVGVSTFVPSGGPLQVNFLTAIDFEASQTFDITLPTKTLSVSVRDTTGQPVTGGRLMFDFSSVSNPPLFDGSMTETSTTVPIDSNGNLSIALLTGLTPTNPRIVLNGSGLSVPFSVPAMDTDRSITVTVPPSVHLTGHLTDAAGGAYPFIGVAFRPLSGAAASTVQTNASGNYSVDLLAGQYKVGVSTFVPSGGPLQVNFLTPVDFESSQTYDITLPTKTLSVSVRDTTGQPVTGGRLMFDFSSVSNPPLFDGSMTETSTTVPLDGNGNLSIALLTGLTPTNLRLVLNSGLTIPFPVLTMTVDRRLFVIFDQTTGTFTIDLTPPAVAGQPSRPPDHNGWYTAPVTIFWVSVDPRPSSGVPTVPPPVTVDTDGANQSVTSQASCDPAGNCATGSYGPINVDQTPPTIVAHVAPAPNAHGWGNTAVTVTFTCSDATSGVASCPDPISVVNEGADQIVTGTAVDNAGNTATVTASVDLDETPPDITASRTPANGSGWNNSPVTVTFTCTDALSGVASCDPPVTLGQEGADQVATGTATDRAGNTASFTVTGIDIDLTPPTVTVSGVTAGATYLQGRVPAATCATIDATSGVATPASLSLTGGGPGSVSATCSGGTDVAGNIAPPVSVAYTVAAPVRSVATNSRNTALNSSVAALVPAGDGLPAGDNVVVAVATGTFTSAVGCTDSQDNSYTVVADRNTGNGRLFVCVAHLTHPLAAGDTVTATYPGFSGLSLISLDEVNPLATGGAVAAATTGAGNSGTPTAGPITTTQTGQLVFGVVSHNSTPTITPGTGYTVVGQVVAGTGSGRRSLTPEYQIAGAAGSYTATATLSGGQFWQAAVVGYQMPAA